MHAYYITKWRTTYTHCKLHKLKKWRLGEASILENCGIVEMCSRKWSVFMCKWSVAAIRLLLQIQEVHTWPHSNV